MWCIVSVAMVVHTLTSANHVVPHIHCAVHFIVCASYSILVCLRTAQSYQNPATLMPDAQFPHQVAAAQGFHRNAPVRSTFSHPVRRVTHDGINMVTHTSGTATSSRSFFGKLALKFSRRLVLLC